MTTPVTNVQIFPHPSKTPRGTLVVTGYNPDVPEVFMTKNKYNSVIITCGRPVSIEEIRGLMIQADELRGEGVTGATILVLPCDILFDFSRRDLEILDFQPYFHLSIEEAVMGDDFENCEYEADSLMELWVHDPLGKVPDHATSITGGNMIPVSIDGTQALLAQLGKNLGMFGGAGDKGETTLETAIRELCEEANVSVDPESVKFALKYSKANARQGGISDNLDVYTGTINPDSVISLDENEITSCTWVNIVEVGQAVEAAFAGGVTPATLRSVQVGEHSIHQYAAMAIYKIYKGTLQDIFVDKYGAVIIC